MEDLTTLWHLAGFALAPLFISIGVSEALAPLLAGLVGFVLAAGLAVLAMLLAPPPPKPDDVKTVFTQTVPPRNFCYGTMLVGGYYMLRVGLHDDALYTVVALCSHRINEFVAFYFHDDQFSPVYEEGINIPGVWGDGAPPPFDSRFLYGGQTRGWKDGRYGESRAWIDWRHGCKPSDPDPVKALEYTTPYWFWNVTAEIPLIWPDTSIGKDICSIGVWCRDAGADEQQKRFPYGAPEPKAVIEGAFLYDPRDPGQDINDESTWEYSDNPVLAIIHWICLSEFGLQQPYDRAILPLEDLWKAQADICDESITTAAGGAQSRYVLGGYGTTDNDPKKILALMLASCDGWLAYRGDGSYMLRVGKWQPSGVTLEYEDIEGFELLRGFADEDVVNRMDVEFTSPDHSFVQVQCDPWQDDDDINKRGKIRDLKYPIEWCQDYRRARRIAVREFKRLREPIRGTLNLRLSGLNACYDRWIYCGDTQIPGLSNHYIEVRAARFDFEIGAIVVDFVAADDTIDQWPPLWFDPDMTLEEAEGRRPPVIEGTIGSPPEPPVVVNAFVEDFTINDPETGDPETAQRIVVDFTAPVDDFEVPARKVYRIRYRVIDTDPDTPGDQPGSWTDETHREDPIVIDEGGVGEPDTLRLKTRAVETRQLMELQMATVSSGGTISDWSLPPFPIVTGSASALVDDLGNKLLDDSGRALVVR